MTSLTCSMKDSLSLSRMNSLSTWPGRDECVMVLHWRSCGCVSEGGLCGYHDLSNLLWVVPVQVKPEGHHLPVVSLQLALGHSVSSAGNLVAEATLVFAVVSVCRHFGFALTLRTFSLALAIFSWRDRLRTERLWCRLMERPSWRPPPPPPPPPPAIPPTPPSLPSLRPEVSEWPLTTRVAKFDQPS